MASNDIVCPTKVAAYIRWSTDDQSEGTTLEVQRESCVHYIKSQGWEFREDLCFIDDGYSGGSLDRPAIKSLRQAVTEGRVSCVVVYKLDRLSRSVMDTVNLVLGEWEGLCHVKSTREPIDTTTSAGKMFFYMLVSYAEWERNVIRERTMSGKKKRAEQGKNPGINPPFGFTTGHKPGEIVMAEDQAAVVRRIFRDYAAGKGLSTIADELNTEGIPSRYGTPWIVSTIQYMLKNEAYKGVLVYGARTHTECRSTGKRQVRLLASPQHARVEGALPVIIEPEFWDAVQAVQQSRSKAAKRSLNGTYLLSGIAKCRCGAPLVGNLIDHRYRFYCCTARRNQGMSACEALSIHAGDVEKEIVEAIKKYYSDANEEGFLASVLNDLEAERQVAEGTLGHRQHRVAELNRRLQRLHADYDAGELNGRLYSERVETTQLELAEANNDLALAHERLAEVERRMRSTADIRVQFQSVADRVDGWQSLTPEEHKQVLRHAIESLTLWCTGKERNPENRRRLRQTVEVDLVLRKPRHLTE